MSTNIFYVTKHLDMQIHKHNYLSIHTPQHTHTRARTHAHNCIGKMIKVCRCCFVAVIWTYISSLLLPRCKQNIRIHLMTVSSSPHLKCQLLCVCDMLMASLFFKLWNMSGLELPVAWTPTLSATNTSFEASFVVCAVIYHTWPCLTCCGASGWWLDIVDRGVPWQGQCRK